MGGVTPGSPGLPGAMDPRPADRLEVIFGGVVIFLEFPRSRPGYSPDRRGPRERRGEWGPRPGGREMIR